MMRIISLKLQNFRNHIKKEWSFGAKTLVMGENGSGKSNMLEAIYMLAVGKSFRADKEEEMISYGEQVTNVEGTMNNLQLRILLTDGTMGVVRKKFEVNGVPKRMIDFLGNFKAVLFGPADMELLTGSPGGRRKYLDFVISQADREYRRCLISYEKGLRQRNKLLEKIREGLAGRNQLFFWDRLLIKNGNYLTEAREKYLDIMNNVQGRMYNAIYDKSVISELRLKQYENEEVAAAATLVGPHRDDFIIAQAPNSKSQDLNKFQIPNSNDQTNFRDVSKYGSRGEQRMAVMWLKKGELSYFANTAPDSPQPVLLLDDIFSELDHKHRNEIEMEIEELVDSGGQVIMTTADEHIQPGGKAWKRLEL